MFKFVIDRNNTLYIGFQSGYHAQICGELLNREVAGAGYLKYDHDVTDWVVHGSSVGYDISFNREQKEAIRATLAGLDDSDVIEYFPSGYRSSVDVGAQFNLVKV